MLCLRVWHCLSIYSYMRVYLYLIYAGLTCIWLYVYFMRITLHGGPGKWQKRGRAKRVLSRFCRPVKEVLVIWKSSAFKLNLFREIFFCYFRLVYSQSMSDRFSAHVRPVIHVTFLHVFQIYVQ